MFCLLGVEYCLSQLDAYSLLSRLRVQNLIVHDCGSNLLVPPRQSVLPDVIITIPNARKEVSAHGTSQSLRCCCHSMQNRVHRAANCMNVDYQEQLKQDASQLQCRLHCRSGLDNRV